jgi:hypothetical protein
VGFAAAFEEFNERQFGERFVLKKEIPSAIQPGGAQVGENQIFVIAKIFFTCAT